MTPAKILLLLFTSVFFLVYFLWFPIQNEELSDALSVKVNEETEGRVVVLSKKNFSQFIDTNWYVMVYFYLPDCSFLQEVLPEYESAATSLKLEAVLAKVDVSQETDLVNMHKIQYVSVHFFVGGVLLHSYYNQKKRDAMVKWARRKMAPGVYKITKPWDARDVLMSDHMFVLACFDNPEDPYYTEELAIASKLVRDVNFYQTTSVDLANDFFHIDPDLQRPALFMLRKDAGEFIQFEDEFTSSEITTFVSANKFPLVTTLSLSNALRIVENPMKQLWLFSSASHSQKLMSAFQEAAKLFNGKLMFVHVERSSNDIERQLADALNFTGDVSRLLAYRRNAKKYIMRDECFLANIKSFGEDFLQGKLSSPTNSEVHYDFTLTARMASLQHNYEK